MIENEYHTNVQHFLDALHHQYLDQAQSSLEQLANARADSALTFYCSGLLLLALNFPAKALIALKKAVEHPQQDIYLEYVEVLAIVCAKLGRNADALYYGKLSPAFERHPDFEHLLPAWLENFEKSLLSKCSLQMTTQQWMVAGAHEKALECLMDLLQFDPHHGQTWTELIRFLRQESRYADIISAFLALQDIRPLDAQEQGLFSYALGHQGRWQESMNILQPWRSEQNESALFLYHRLYREAAPFFSLQALPIPADIQLFPDGKKEVCSLPSTTALERPITIALMAQNWQPFHLPSLIAPLFDSRHLQEQQPYHILLLDMSPHQTLQHSFLAQTFPNIVAGFVGDEPIDPQTFATILSHSGVDCLINIDHTFSGKYEIYRHFSNLPKPTVIASLLDADCVIEKDSPIHILTDSYIHRNETKPQKMLAPSHSLFSIHNQQLTKPKLATFPLTIGLCISPCHLYKNSGLSAALQAIDQDCPDISLLVYTPKAGGISATYNLFPEDFFQNLQVAFSQPHVSIMEFCRECHVILQASPLVDDCYPFAGLMQSIPVCHLKESEQPQVMYSILKAFEQPQWSFDAVEDLIALLTSWQKNPAIYKKARQDLHAHNLHIQQTAPTSNILPIVHQIREALQHG